MLKEPGERQLRGGGIAVTWGQLFQRSEGALDFFMVRIIRRNFLAAREKSFVNRGIGKRGDAKFYTLVQDTVAAVVEAAGRASRAFVDRVQADEGNGDLVRYDGS